MLVFLDQAWRRQPQAPVAGQSLSHEKNREEEPAAKAPDRAFGWVMGVFFFIVAALPLWAGQPWRAWALFVAAGFIAAALLLPALLSPLNRVWMAFGEMLRRVMSPLMLAVIFFGVITPMGLLMRLFGKDPMRRRLDAKAASYWIHRDPPGPRPESFTDQF